MPRRGRNRLLVPGAEEGVNRFKKEVVNQVLGTNITNSEDVKMEVAKQFDIPLRKRGGNGDIRAEDAGKIGGFIGGNMVKEMVRLAQRSMARKD
ncbi:alpha/beta-type small acid-soluble spore protein [Thermoactinomyces sp. CICC 10523]|uniref:alpha/beta-type small acid-soluble spore protein n=1 Tax=Thermoactinomyces sp. CICC 10523 TaxID=2767428 RepID=UPI0018DD286D|nr:alpha/beta-type small acid-soluble spore protein [Thermoactinomyces sp. CICC 10523]MBH8597064.1 alpha/beta-type small acid-soluble spore protein [Thermoactinomyces sp. CICC 10523]